MYAKNCEKVSDFIIYHVLFHDSCKGFNVPQIFAFIIQLFGFGLSLLEFLHTLSSDWIWSCVDFLIYPALRAAVLAFDILLLIKLL